MTTPTLSSRGFVRAAWPIWTLFAAYPLWWAIGMSQFVWPIVGAVCAFQLVARGSTALPRPFGLWFLFLGWMLASFVELQFDLGVLAFLLRAALYLSATVIGLWVFNRSETELPTRTVVQAVAAMWIATVAFGYLALAFPHFTFGTPVEHLLPHSVSSDSFVQTFVHPGLSETQHVFGKVAQRLRAPFTYSNEWGSFFALLTPFAVLQAMSARRRAWWFVALAASVVPAVLSLDRAMWVSLLIAGLYVGGRLLLRRRVRGSAIAATVAAAVVVVVSPLGSIALDRLGSPQSNDARHSVTTAAIHGANASPLLGYGGPRKATEPYVPPVGTQGQLWLVLVSHGYPGALLFVGFLVCALWRIRRWKTTTDLLLQSVIVMTLVQMPFYNENLVLHVTFVAIALGLRSTKERSTPVVEELVP